jgi:hypothetical protein
LRIMLCPLDSLVLASVRAAAFGAERFLLVFLFLGLPRAAVSAVGRP